MSIKFEDEMDDDLFAVLRHDTDDQTKMKQVAQGEAEPNDKGFEEWEDDIIESVEEEADSDGVSVEDQVDAAIQKLVRETIGVMPEQVEDDTEEEDDRWNQDVRKKKSRKGLIAGVLIAAVLLLAGGGFYISRAVYYGSHFMEGTTINGVNCSDLTAEKVEELIRAEAEDYSLTLKFRDGKSEVISGNDIEYKYIPDGSVEKLLKSQNNFSWVLENSGKRQHEVEVAMQYSEEKLDAVLDSFPEMQTGNMVAPADAYLDFKETQFVVVDEVYGTAINTEKAKRAVADAVAVAAVEIDLEEAGAYEQPTVTKDDKSLNEKKEELNELISANITFELPGGTTQKLDGSILKEWLHVDEQGNYSKDEELWNNKIAEYVSTLASSIDTYGKERTFPATGISNGVTVSQSTYGWKVDQEAEIAQLTEDLANHVTASREPSYSSREFSTENYGFGNTYVEVDISRQHIWFYKDGSLVLDSNCVTGMMVRSRYTPAGIFTVKSKTSPKTLRGPKQPDGSYEWESDVTYWMPFNGGIGFHDASWRGAFGGTIYKGGGSHGCVNLPTSAARTLYQNIEVGTPVIVYYSEAYSVAADPVTAAPTKAPTPEATPEPTPEATPEPTPEATPEPTPETTPEATPEPTPEPTPESPDNSETDMNSGSEATPQE